MIVKKIGMILLSTLLLFAGCGDDNSSSTTCKTGTTETQQCGSNDNGEQTRSCVDNRWTEWSICKTSGECVNGTTEDQVCGLNSNGTSTRTCVDQTWGEYGDCVDPDICQNDAVTNQKCGTDDTGSQNRRCTSGQWGEWSTCEIPGECTNGATEDQVCGLNSNGTSTRTCVDQTWGEYGDCIDPDICQNDAVTNQKCGTDDTGSQNRRCTSGQWGEWSTCEIPGECTNGATEDQVCGLNSNGTSTRTCVDQTWGEYGDCIDPDICQNDLTQDVPCGSENAGIQTQTCINGQWDTSAECVITGCTDGKRLQGESCGTDGVMIQVCRNDEWSEALCHEKDGDLRTFTVYIQTEDDALTSYLMDAAEHAWNYFNSIHLGLREQGIDPVVSYHPAFRFNNVQIPANTEIINVSISFYPNSDVDNDKLRINIYGEKQISSQPFDPSNYENNRPDQRAKTAIKVPENTHNPESWRIQCKSDCCSSDDLSECPIHLWDPTCDQRKLDCWRKDTRYTVPHNLAPIATEITGLDGWLDGNSMTFFMMSALDLNNGDSVGTRTINDFDERGIEYNPSLTVQYRLPAK